MLSVDDLSVRFGGLDALAGVTFTADGGQITGVIGPNGAGKSTLLNALTGWVRPLGGTAMVDGQQLIGRAPHDIVGLGVVRTFQNLELFDGLTVAENLAIGGQTHLRSSLLASVTGRRSCRDEERRLRDRISAVADRLDIASILDRAVVDLPFGYRKQVEVARALMVEPSVLLLDEPAAGLDTHEIDVLADTLGELRRDGLTIMLVEHEMGLVMSLCDQLVVVDFGRVIATGPPSTVRDDPVVREAYLGSTT